MSDWLVAGLLLLGGSLMLLAAVGVLRMPDVFTRMSAATKASALGVGCVLLAVAVHFADLGVTTRVVLVIAFVLLTTPVSAHRIGRSAYFVGVPLWAGTTRDELRGHYHPTTHALQTDMPNPADEG